jgi:hypothetical protein
MSGGILVKYARVTISIPEDLLAEIDADASAAGVSRSAVIQEAAARYVVEKRSVDAAEEHRRSVGQALEGFRKIRETPVRDPRPTLELLREIRDHHGGASAPGDDVEPLK